MTVYMYHTHLMGEPPGLLLLGPMRKMLGLRRRRRSSRRSTTRRRRRREAADDGDRRRERLDAEGRVRGARLEPRRREGRRREGGAGEREDLCGNQNFTARSC